MAGAVVVTGAALSIATTPVPAPTVEVSKSLSGADPVGPDAELLLEIDLLIACDEPPSSVRADLNVDADVERDDDTAAPAVTWSLAADDAELVPAEADGHDGVAELRGVRAECVGTACTLPVRLRASSEVTLTFAWMLHAEVSATTEGACTLTLER